MNLIVGSESTIGATLSNFWFKNNISFHTSTRNTELVSNQRLFIDLTQQHTFKRMYGYKSAVICADITDMAICETNPDETKTVNVTGTIELIKQFLQKKIHIVFLSTNQVFDGEEPMRKPDAPRNLINEYGKQKAESRS